MCSLAKTLITLYNIGHRPVLKIFNPLLGLNFFNKSLGIYRRNWNLGCLLLFLRTHLGTPGLPAAQFRFNKWNLAPILKFRVCGPCCEVQNTGVDCGNSTCAQLSVATFNILPFNKPGKAVMETCSFLLPLHCLKIIWWVLHVFIHIVF